MQSPPAAPKDLSLLPCTHLHGVGERTASHLAQLDIHCIQDLLFHLPLRYQDRTRVTPIRQLSIGDHVMIEGTLTTVNFPKGGRTRLLCRFADATGHLHLRFFYINIDQRQVLRIGARLRCFGEVRFGQYGLEIVHPEYRLLTEKNETALDEQLTPIYPATAGLGQSILRKLTKQALELLSQGALLQDILPPTLVADFPALSHALHYIHRPPVDAKIEALLSGQHICQKRIGFEELLAHRLSLLKLKNAIQAQKAAPLIKNETITQQFLQNLKFTLTAAQLRVAAEIFQDLQQPRPMLRLIQGDVGSGKTIVAALALLQAVANGHQAALLAPTELLAEQHYRTFRQWFSPLAISVELLVGPMKATAKRNLTNALATGTVQIIIGTHALLQKNITFAKLALIVVDEQHRFGVAQRALLREKGIAENHSPHQLMMTATPIPRTLAMSLYADLDCSMIDELPPGRVPVVTRVVANTRRAEIVDRIANACLAGKQVYWVCTLITESDVLQCQAAEETVEQLRVALPQLKIALLHGQMKPAEKTAVMAAFKENTIHLLVATTVIEVGVDVPNASLMVIENAERLGLAQLHQLRGRVGRGSTASYCLLMYQSPLSAIAQERLTVMRETTDGFEIAQRDLELRGPGEVLGTRQTGDVTLRIADLMRDQDLLLRVQQAADNIQQSHPGLISPLVKRWLGQRVQYQQV